RAERDQERVHDYACSLARVSVIGGIRAVSRDMGTASVKMDRLARMRSCVLDNRINAGVLALVGVFALVACSACSASSISHEIALDRVFPTGEHPGVTLPGCPFASPLVNGAELVVADTDGTVRRLDRMSGDQLSSVSLPAPAGEQAFIVATPVAVGD